MEKLAIKANVSRVECNMPHCLVNTGSWYNGQPWIESLGCGIWAGNMTSDNINWRHFQDIYGRTATRTVSPENAAFIA